MQQIGWVVSRAQEPAGLTAGEVTPYSPFTIRDDTGSHGASPASGDVDAPRSRWRRKKQLERNKEHPSIAHVDDCLLVRALLPSFLSCCTALLIVSVSALRPSSDVINRSRRMHVTSVATLSNHRAVDPPVPAYISRSQCHPSVTFPCPRYNQAREPRGATEHINVITCRSLCLSL